MSEAKVTERGWPGHYVGAANCIFRRNTLIECRDRKIIVSTVGNYRSRGSAETIGLDRYYETMAFEAQLEGKYWEADVTKEVDFHSPWRINEINDNTDNEANEMHETIVQEIALELRRLNKHK